MLARTPIGGFVAVSVAIAIAGCTGGTERVADEFPPGEPCGPSCAPIPDQAGLVIENRTGASVDLTTRQASLVVDERILAGTLDVPIGDAALGAPRRSTVNDRESVLLTSTIVVSNGFAPSQMVGGVIAVGDGPPLLAVGSGKIFVRTANDGSPFLEAEDPKTTSLAGLDHSMTECEPGSLDAPFDDVPRAMYEGTDYIASAWVRTITRDDHGCRLLDLTISDESSSYDTQSLGTVRACIPDIMWPFAADEILRVSGGWLAQGSTMTLYGQDGTSMDLIRVGFEARTFKGLPDVALAVDHDPRCARIDATCGHVDLPARITAQTADGKVQQAVFGAPLEDMSGGAEVYVLGAASHAVTNQSCGAKDRPPPRADAWLVRVRRP